LEKNCFDVSRLNVKIRVGTICLVIAQVVLCHDMNDGNHGEGLNLHLELMVVVGVVMVKVCRGSP
jgi:hypothetical protein